MNAASNGFQLSSGLRPLNGITGNMMSDLLTDCGTPPKSHKRTVGSTSRRHGVESKQGRSNDMYDALYYIILSGPIAGAKGKSSALTGARELS